MSSLGPGRNAESGRPLIVGRYRLEDDAPIGRGGMGEVWRASDTTLNRLVALKKVQLDGVTGHAIEEVKQQTLREGQIIARLHHPNIVAIHDVVTDGDRLMLVLEYVPSRGADAVLAAQGPFPLHVAVKIGIQLTEALTAIHSQGVLHRDITPGNVLIDTSWNAKLTDFGIAQVTIDLRRTTTVASIGTPAFMAPETARGETATTATDIYGLGATIWTLVEGVPPFHQPGPDNPMRLMHRIATGQLTPPTNAGALTSVLAAMTSGEPTRRPNAPTARDMFTSAAQLISARHTTAGSFTPSATMSATGNPPFVPVQSGPLPTSAAPPGPAHNWQAPTSAVPRTGNRRRWFVRPAVIISAAVLLLIAAIGATIMLTRGTEHPQAAAPSPPPDKYLPHPTLVDTCALAKLPNYALFGKPNYFQAPFLSSCQIGIDLTGGGGALIRVQIFEPAVLTFLSSYPTEQRGDLKIISPPQPEPHQCDRFVVLPDQNVLDVETTTMSSTMNPCTLSGMGIDSTVTHLQTVGSVPELPNPVPPNSLRRQNACQLLTAADVAEIPGLDTSQLYPQYANWACSRGADLKQQRKAPWVLATFESGSPLVAGTNGTLQTIAGRSVFVQPVTDPAGNNCAAQIVHSNTLLPTGGAIEEVVAISVHDDVVSDQQCQLAVKLATKVIPRLPPAN